jgi:hypothetical protein
LLCVRIILIIIVLLAINILVLCHHGSLAELRSMAEDLSMVRAGHRHVTDEQLHATFQDLK